MSTLELITRPVEEEALFNPAFLALVVRAAAAEHEERSEGCGMPVVLAYLVAPLALHGPTRRSLPSNVTAQMGEWIRNHPEALVDLADHARALRPFVSAGIRLGLTYDVLDSREGAIKAKMLRRRPRGMARSEDAEACIGKGGFLGRWFAEQPDPLTAMAWWGVRP